MPAIHGYFLLDVEKATVRVCPVDLELQVGGHRPFDTGPVRSYIVENSAVHPTTGTGADETDAALAFNRLHCRLRPCRL